MLPSRPHSSTLHWRRPVRDRGCNTPRHTPSQAVHSAAALPMEADEYETKMFEDKEGEELGNTARIWRVYKLEAAKADGDLIQGWRDTLDVLLVFAGLFSSVVTTFVVQAYQSLQPDYTLISATLFHEALKVQNATILPIHVLPPLKDIQTFHPAATDVYIAALWFTSLAISLSTALLAVLVKQWLLMYTSRVSWSVRESTCRREFRHEGLRRWRVANIINLLPQLLSLALLLFFAGLIVLLFTLHATIAIMVTSIVSLVYLFHLLSGMISFFYPQCPYHTPPSFFHIFFRAFRWAVLCIPSSIWNFPYRSILINASTFSEYESSVIQSLSKQLEASALASLYWSSTNPAVQDVVLHSLAALHRHPATDLIVAKGLHLEVMNRLREPASQMDGIIHQVPQSQWRAADEAVLVELAADPGITRLARAFIHFSNHFGPYGNGAGMPPEGRVSQAIAVQWQEIAVFTQALRYVRENEMEAELEETETLFFNTITGATAPAWGRDN